MTMRHKETRTLVWVGKGGTTPLTLRHSQSKETREVTLLTHATAQDDMRNQYYWEGPGGWWRDENQELWVEIGTPERAAPASTTLLDTMQALHRDLEAVARAWVRQMPAAAKRQRALLIKQGAVNVWDLVLLNHPSLAVRVAASLSRTAETLRQEIVAIEAAEQPPNLQLARKKREPGSSWDDD